jgi:hypothetical protein
MSDIHAGEAASHGRGGIGNIGPDDGVKYGDGEIVRGGNPGTDGEAFSTGRGGAANIGTPKHAATKAHDDDIVPEAALRPSMEDRETHVGRGGAGNEVHPGEQKVGSEHHDGLADKLKRKIFGGGKKETTT